MLPSDLKMETELPVRVTVKHAVRLGLGCHGY
jgi:hypothetical protein